MDRVTRNSSSKINANTNDNLNNHPMLGNSQGSVFARVSASIGRRAASALPAPPSIAVPTVQSALWQVNLCSFEDDLPDETVLEQAMPFHINNNTANNIGIQSVPDGSFQMSLPPDVTDASFHNFVSVQSQNIDLCRVTGIKLRFCNKLTGTSLRVLSERFKALKHLDLTGCFQFNDADFAHLAQMNNLDNLCLAGCSGISKKGFQYLCPVLDGIEVLDLTSCPQVDDTVLSYLPNMHQMKHLVLTACTQFTHAGIGELGKLDKLQSLILDQCDQISDVTLSKLHADSGFKGLRQINLRNCPHITGNGIQALKQGLKKLNRVNADPGVTPHNKIR
ncbi:MAG: hypothetical protein RLO04_07665 [Limnobacter sp.]|uniref:hypothetical protein n=1 Tax=Limnobacter sp. TaxID=2003368 RepID=UPI0032ED2F4B